MDPSIMKLLEEDEDETMHSGADVDAFTAALNRDIEGDNNSFSISSSQSQSQPQSLTSTDVLSQQLNRTPSELFQQWQSSTRQVEVKIETEQQQSSVMEINRHGNDTSGQPSNGSQLKKMQRIGCQQADSNEMNQTPVKQVPFALLMPVILPQLDKDRSMQLNGLYAQLRSNRISKEEFVRRMRDLVGDHTVKMALFKLQQEELSGKWSSQRKSAYVPSSSIHPSSDTRSPPIDNTAQKPQSLERQSDAHGIQASHMSSNISAIKQERQLHMHFPQSPFPTYGNTGARFHSSSSSNMNMSSQPIKQQIPDLQMRQGPVHPNMGTQSMNQNPFSDTKKLHEEGLTQLTNNSSLQQTSSHWQPSMNKMKPEDQQVNKVQRLTPQGPSSLSSLQLESSKDEGIKMSSLRPGFSASMYKPEPVSIRAQLERHNAVGGNSSLASGSNAKTPPKMPTVGQKKPLETTPVSSLSKKQKVTGEFADQSLEQLNDVTAVSGVNLREEEEQLFSGSKEDIRASEAARKVVREEEKRLIVQKIPLMKKLAVIMAKCGVKSRSGDVERCLSLCVEERMSGLISNLIRLSKQGVDIEKPRHRTVIMSDVRQQIMSMNQKAREEWEKKQADGDKLQRADESNGSGDGEDGRGKSSKVVSCFRILEPFFSHFCGKSSVVIIKVEDDKMRTTAANVAARAAVGGDDMLSKWQVMAEQARQKREGGSDAPSPSQPSIDVVLKPVSTSERSSKENPDTEKTSASVTATPGPVRKSIKNRDLSWCDKSVPRTISVKDVISVLGRESQMSRSTLLYRLYEKVRSDSV